MAKSRQSFILKCFLLVEIISQSTVVSVSVEIEHASNGSRMRRDLLSSDGGDKNQVTTMNVAFDLPDLTVTIETTTGTDFTHFICCLLAVSVDVDEL